MDTRRTRLSIIGAALVATAILAVPTTLAHAQDDPGLDQIIDPNQAQGTGNVILDDGHIDYGPTLNTGEWIIQIHDDTSQPSYWRMPGEVVAKVNDGSMLTVPDDSAYDFLGLEPGKEVWVIPQVREPGVIWAGWNTQEPTVLDSLNMGATQRILGVEGSGEVSVYLQSGNFGDPQPLWSTLEPFPQESWIEVNTHTHANWVFSEPGVYLVQLEFSGELIDGTSVSAQDTLRFAVGDATDADDAFGMEFDTSVIETPGTDEPDVGEAELAPDSAGLAPILGIVLGAIALALVVAAVLVAVASRRAKARARAARSQRVQVEEDGE